MNVDYFKQNLSACAMDLFATDAANLIIDIGIEADKPTDANKSAEDRLIHINRAINRFRAKWNGVL